MRKQAVVALLLAGAVAVPAYVRAHEGHEHKAMGKVAVLDAAHIEVEGQDGKKTSVQLTPATKYMKDKTAATAADVKVGQRVVVVYVEDEKAKVLTATQVLLGVSDKTAAPEKPHEHH